MATKQQIIDEAKKALREDMDLLKVRTIIEAGRLQMLRDGLSEATPKVQKVYDSILREMGIRLSDTDGP